MAAQVVREVAGVHPFGDADYADFATAFQGPVLERELVEAALEEAKIHGTERRVRELERRLARLLEEISLL